MPSVSRSSSTERWAKILPFFRNTASSSTCLLYTSNKSNTALLEAVNAALEELKADGTLQAIVDKYIKAE